MVIRGYPRLRKDFLRTIRSVIHPVPDPQQKQRRRLLIIVWSALAVWMILLSVGTSLYAPAPGAGKAPSVDWRRGLLVFAFVGGFLGLWVWLAIRKRPPGSFRDGLPVTGDGADGIQDRQQQSSDQSQKDE